MNVKDLDEQTKIDIKETMTYFGKSLLYSFLIGSAVISIARNYRKAMLNEEIYSFYKLFRPNKEDEFSQ